MKKFIVFACLAWCFACQALILQGRVVKVADGDTITILDVDMVQHKIRLSGIDAPEKNQAFGWRSKHQLGLMVFGQWVSVETQKKDKYGRQVGKVLVQGVDANLAQIKNGLAWHYTAYAKEQSTQDRAEYSDAQTHARALQLGLWQDPQPVPPWDYRRSKKK